MTGWAHSRTERDTRAGVRAEIAAWLPAAADSPRYTRLATAMLDDPEMLDVVASIDNVPPMNLLFGAVQLLRGGPLPDLPYGEFREFVLGRRADIVEIGCTRRTQTNEVRRCAAILPFLADAVAGFGAGLGPVHVVDVGASAGLNLCLDLYAYDYGDVQVGAGALTLSCENRGGFAVPRELPQFATRTGLDLAPVDVEDADAVAWLEALVWPEQSERLERLRAAIAIRRETDVTMVAGDAVDTLPRVVAGLPPGPVLIFHTIALYQMPSRAREELDSIVADLARERPLARVCLEPRPGATYPLIHVGPRPHDSAPVAQAHPHGAWIARPV